ncbi:hypothetical protein MCEMSEM45_00225 [Candidatus Pelagibacterales bacterium]
MYKLPILILTYNRPEQLSRLVNQIKKIRPMKVYVGCDGPKNNFDRFQIKKIKNILNSFDKKTKLFKKFYKKNKGIKLSVQSSISWFFKNEKMGLILEDDCIPKLIFFQYMKHLLFKYKNNKKIYAISGYNPFGKTKFGSGTYFASNFFLCWGWGSWRRSWRSSYKKIDYFVRNPDKYLSLKLKNTTQARFWKKMINRVHNGFITSWAILFLFSAWRNNAFILLPNINMIDNVGFNQSATTSPGLNYKTAKSFDYKKKIKDPPILQIDKKNEQLVFNKTFNPHSFLYPGRFLYLIKYLLFNPKLFFFKIKIYIKNYIK